MAGAAGARDHVPVHPFLQRLAWRILPPRSDEVLILFVGVSTRIHLGDDFADRRVYRRILDDVLVEMLERRLLRELVGRPAPPRPLRFAAEHGGKVLFCGRSTQAGRP